MTNVTRHEHSVDHDHVAAEERYWRDLAPTHERSWRETKAHLVLGLERLLLSTPVEGNVLEIGAGLGWASATLKQHWPAATVTATDISPSVHRLAAATHAEIGAVPDHHSACDMAQLPFADGSFDLVFGIAVLHHADDVTAVMREVRRVLRPGGRYFGMDEFAAGPALRGFWRTSRWSPFARRHGELSVQEAVYTLGEWRAAVHDAGFTQAKVALNRDWRLKRSDGGRRWYFLLSSPLPDAVFSNLLGGSIVVSASK
jgi:ubiquinone/menaquinone biosynthesis C-methylase UbiE